MTAKLYCFGESGNAYKAALALTFTDMDWEPVFVDFFNGEARSPAFRDIEMKGFFSSTDMFSPVVRVFTCCWC